MLTPTMSQLGINFVTDKSDSCLTRPQCDRFCINTIKHTSGWITRSIHDQDAWICPFSACLGQYLCKNLWSQTMMIRHISWHINYSPTNQMDDWDIAHPRRNWQEHIPIKDV